MSPVRVLFLNSSVSGGGAGHALVSLVKSLDPARIEPHVVLPFDGVVGESLRAAGARVHFHPLLPERFGKTYLGIPRFLRKAWIERLINVALFPKIILDLRKLVREIDAQLIYANHLIHFPISVGLSRVTGVPALFHAREILEPGIGRWYFRWIATSPVVRKVVCISKAVEKIYEGSGKTDLIYDRLAVRDHRDGVHPVLRKEFGIPSDRVVIGFMGRIVEWKGIPLLLDAFADVRSSEPLALLTIVGGNDPGLRSDLLGEYRAQARRLGIESDVIFTGFKKDPRPYAADFDLAALPSLTPEPFGMVITEAMALEVPPVVADHGGASEIVTDGVDGLKFPPRSREGLAAAMLRLVRDAPLRRELGKRALETVHRRFDAFDGSEAYGRAIVSAARGEA